MLHGYDCTEQSSAQVSSRHAEAASGRRRCSAQDSGRAWTIGTCPCGVKPLFQLDPTDLPDCAWPCGWQIGATNMRHSTSGRCSPDRTDPDTNMIPTAIWVWPIAQFKSHSRALSKRRPTGPSEPKPKTTIPLDNLSCDQEDPFRKRWMTNLTRSRREKVRRGRAECVPLAEWHLQGARHESARIILHANAGANVCSNCEGGRQREGV